MTPNRRLRAKQAKSHRKRVVDNPLALYEPKEIDNVVRDKIILGETDFIELRLSYYRNKLVSFFIGLFEIRDGTNIEIFSVDTHHGWLHKHIHGHRKSNDRRDIRQLLSQVDVQESHDEAYEMVLKKYESKQGVTE